MASRTERFEDHQLNAKLTTIDGLLSDIDSIHESQLPDAIAEFERIRQVHAFIKRKLQSVDPNMIALQTAFTKFKIDMACGCVKTLFRFKQQTIGSAPGVRST